MITPGPSLFSDTPVSDFTRLAPSQKNQSSALPVVSKDGPDEIKAAAIAFEASFIAQMLTFSGLDKALTAGGGDDMAAFTSFYIQSFAEEIAENGGFGLADKFYNRMVALSDPQAATALEDSNVDFGRL